MCSSDLRGGSVYYWYTAIGTDERAINITDIPVDHVLSDPFTTSTGTPTVTVADPYHNALVGDSVAFSGATAVGGLTIAGSYSVATVVDATAYTITAGSNASSTATGGGVVTATYAYNNTAPTKAEFVVVSDVFRFLLAFGCNDLGSTDADPMLIRWANQETVTDWYPSATNQAGSLRLSRGSKIVAAVQMKQEILVLTDSAAYSLQYLGAPAVWGATLLADNISIQGMNAVTVASGVAYWMGINKFYMYNGTVSTLPSDLRQYVFGDFNLAQGEQTFAGSNERFNEVWWFYCVDGKYFNTKYVVFNYIENAWYYGDLSRTAWLDSNVQDYPIAAYGPLLSEFDPDLYPANVFDEYLLYHELGVDDESGDTPAPINAFVESGEFDIDDGDHFGFVYRILPDLTFRGSTADNPNVTMTLYPMKNSGSGYGESIAGSENATVTRIVSVPVEEFTGQVFVRVRGRQMVLRIESNTLGVAWQLRSPRIDIRQDGRR